MRFKNPINVVIVMSGLFFMSGAYAEAGTSFMVEPYVGYEGLGSTNQTFSGTSTSLGTMSGVSVGGRASIGFAEMFFVGADFSYDPSLSISPPSGTTSEFSSISKTKLGVVAGVDVPMFPLRVWGGFNFLDKLNATDITGGISNAANSQSTLGGSSIKGGIGFKLIPLVSINVEYIYSTYNSITSGGTVTNFASGDSITHSNFLFSVSLPLML